MSGLAYFFFIYMTATTAIYILVKYPTFVMLLNRHLVKRVLILIFVQLCSAAKLLQQGQYGAVSFPAVVDMEAVFDFHDRPESVPHTVLGSPVYPARRDLVFSSNDKPNGLQVKRTLLSSRQTCRDGSKYCPST